MTHDDPQLARRLARERAVIRYLSALEGKDSNALAAVLHEAQTDPLLMHMIDEVNQACVIEDSALDALPARPGALRLSAAPPEHRLTIEFRVQENPMNTTATLRPPQTLHNRRVPLSFTLLATVAAVALISVAMLVLSGVGMPERPTTGAAAGLQASATPTAVLTLLPPTLVPVQVAPAVIFPVMTSLQINGFTLETAVAGVYSINTAADGRVTITLDRPLPAVLVYQLVTDVLRRNLQPAGGPAQFQLVQPGQSPLVVQILPLSAAAPASDNPRILVIRRDPSTDPMLLDGQLMASVLNGGSLVEGQPVYIEFALPALPRLVIVVPMLGAEGEPFTLATVTWGSVEATVVFIEGNIEGNAATLRAEVESTVSAVQTLAAGYEATARAVLPPTGTATPILPTVPPLAVPTAVTVPVLPTLPPLPGS